MKKLVSVFVMLIGASVFAGQPPSVSPTMYHCTGADNTVVGYTTTSLTGQPTFHVDFQGKEVKNRPGINVINTYMGNLVSVVDTHMIGLDGPTMAYTLILPRVTLSSTSEKWNFNAMLVKTTTRNPFFHALPNTGNVQTNEFVDVNCEAQFVVF